MFSLPIEDDPVLDPPPTNGIPGVDKEKAPWVQELKMNQAKKTTSNSVIGMIAINMSLFILLLHIMLCIH